MGTELPQKKKLEAFSWGNMYARSADMFMIPKWVIQTTALLPVRHLKICRTAGPARFAEPVRMISSRKSDSVRSGRNFRPVKRQPVFTGCLFLPDCPPRSAAASLLKIAMRHCAACSVSRVGVFGGFFLRCPPALLFPHAVVPEPANLPNAWLRLLVGVRQELFRLRISTQGGQSFPVCLRPAFPFPSSGFGMVYRSA